VHALILACLLEEQVTEAADGDAREEVPLDCVGEMGALAESRSIQQGRARRRVRTLGDQLNVAVIQRVRQGRADSRDVDADDLPGGNAGAVARAARRLALGWSQTRAVLLTALVLIGVTTTLSLIGWIGLLYVPSMILIGFAAVRTPRTRTLQP